MKNCIMLFSLLVFGCIGGEEEPEVSFHEEALTVNITGTANADKICLASFQSGAGAWTDWACLIDPITLAEVNADITGFSRVNIYPGGGNDVVVVRAVDVAGGSTTICPCSCPTGPSTYGAIHDYRYNLDPGAGVFHVNIYDGASPSGSDAFFGGNGGRNYFEVETGNNIMHGGPDQDKFQMASSPSTSTNIAWDDGASTNDIFTGGASVDKFIDIGCGFTSFDCGGNTNDVQSGGAGNGTCVDEGAANCEINGTFSEPSCIW